MTGVVGWQSIKPLLTFLLLLGSLAILANDGAVPQPMAAAPGRFQIAVGYTTAIETPNQEDRITLRIDTATGETWKLQTVPLSVGEGKRLAGFEMWNRIQEVNGDLHKIASQQMSNAPKAAQ